MHQTSKFVRHAMRASVTQRQLYKCSCADNSAGTCCGTWKPHCCIRSCMWQQHWAKIIQSELALFSSPHCKPKICMTCFGIDSGYLYECVTHASRYGYGCYKRVDTIQHVKSLFGGIVVQNALLLSWPRAWH